MNRAVADTLKSKSKRTSARFVVDITLNNKSDNTVYVGKTLPFNRDNSLKEGDVQNFNKEFINILEELRLCVRDDLSISEDDYAYFMKQLAEIGSAACAMLPEGLPEHIARLEEDYGDRGLSLDFAYPAEMDLLWEMIYTGDPDEEIDPLKFWGLRYPIGHLYVGTDMRDFVRLQKGVFASSHDELPCSIQELCRLEEMLAEIRRQYQQEVSVLRVEEALAADVLEGDKLLAYFNGEEFGFGVVHFACHCENPKDEDKSKGATEAYLRFTAHQNELNLYLTRITGRAKKGFRRRPLVFLNACESKAPLHFLQSLNFPSVFIRFGAGGVIATSCTMPDSFASAYASEFYTRLLNKPFGDAPTTAYVGETLLETNRHFLAKRNLLGLAYGLYAYSNQELKTD